MVLYQGSPRKLIDSPTLMLMTLLDYFLIFSTFFRFFSLFFYLILKCCYSPEFDVQLFSFYIIYLNDLIPHKASTTICVLPIKYNNLLWLMLVLLVNKEFFVFLYLCVLNTSSTILKRGHIEFLLNSWRNPWLRKWMHLEKLSILLLCPRSVPVSFLHPNFPNSH